jgi:hypothetical protein
MEHRPAEPRQPAPGADRRRLWIAIAALGVAALVAIAIVADLGPFADEELSEAEFLARGDEVCREAHEEFEDLQAQNPNTASEAAGLTGSLIEISEGELDQIRDLNAPASVERPLDRYLGSREDGIEQLQKGLEAAEDGDAFAYADAQAKVAAEQVHRLKLAKQVGFTECSRVLFGREQLAADAEPPLSTDPNAPPTVNNPPTGTP